MTNKLPREEFYKALEAARSARHGGRHPFSAAWAAGKLSREQLGKWAIQHYYYIDPIPQQFAALFARLPDLEARQHLLENLLGEEMPHAPEKRHPELLLKFAAACGVSRETCLNAEANGLILPGTLAMRSWIWELSTIRPLAEASSGIMVALEGQLPTLYPDYVKAMREMGFTEDDLEFFHVHIEGDEGHAEVGLRLAYEYSLTEHQQKMAIAAVSSSASLRYNMLSGIFSSVVENVAA
ncbi:TenA family transcriptional regulator [Govanella unica]|uniref:Iron-containing redox enzyme family protein n=1 Tax=Govanella unica TaxID=2975056 RepID=A0A9X3Z695_9PROT|nr:iron-containing redox enzyme family protein [Govania unica]MDA5192901.1 iron-containing redox enzyme family protein [Govania unica]